MTEGARIGRLIYELRLKTGFTQEEVANTLFISQSYLRQIEHGLANPSVNMVAKIISFLVSAISGHPAEVELFRLDTLLESISRWRYQLIQETWNIPEVGWIPTCAILVEERTGDHWESIALLHDVAVDPSVVRRIVERLNAEQLSPLHFLDVVGDLLP